MSASISRFARRATLFLLVPCLLAAPACTAPVPVFCLVDADCDGMACARTNECVPADELKSVRISWTLYGQPASDELCSMLAIDRMRATFEDNTNFDDLSYEPVPCAAGQIFYNRMPDRFDTFALKAVGVTGTVRDTRRVTLRDRDTTATLDLLP